MKPAPYAAGSSLIGLVLVAAGACGNDRAEFTQPPERFQTDAATDAPVCGVQCSIDGRSIIDTCTNEVVETCPQELACGAARCQEPCAAAAADRSSNGCEFYFQMPRYWDNPQSCFAAFIVNTSALPLNLSLEREGKALDLSNALYRTNPGDASLLPLEGALAPGESAVLFVADRTGLVANSRYNRQFYVSCPSGVVPALVADLATGTHIDPAFHLTTDVPASVAAVYPWGGAASYFPSATLLFPVASWGKEHVVVNAWEKSDDVGAPGAQIVASEDDTEVTIDPTEDIQNGTGIVGTVAGLPVTYHLDKGQFLQLVQGRELTGSVVTSNKPTTVFGGHACMFVPTTNGACDTANQQLPPFNQWGHEYVGVGHPPRGGNEHEKMYYRIVAARDGTVLDYDPSVPPGAPIAMSAREAVTFTSGVGDAFVVRTQDAEHPIYLAAYMRGGGEIGDSGDPEFVNVVPAGQYLSSYSFYADPTYAQTSLIVVRARTSRGEFKDVWLECAGDLPEWKPVGTRGAYEFTRVALARNGPGDRFGDKVCQSGLQRMRSEGPFTATLWGWDYFASYAYPGGMAQRKLVTTPLVPVQ